jgi:hypothetical protein
MAMAKIDLMFGDQVLIPWGFEDYVRGTVQEVYGPPARRHVVVLLTPEVSGTIVEEPSTVSMPIDAVKKAAPAA